MKNLTYLFSILFAVTLLSTSCEKDNTVVPEPEGITVQDLVGDWNFVSVEYNGTVYTECAPELSDLFALVDLNLLNVTETTLAVYTTCGINGGTGDLSNENYTFTNNTIDYFTGAIVLEIQNVDTFDGSVLVLKLIDASAPTVMPIGAIFTLEHSN